MFQDDEERNCWDVSGTFCLLVDDGDNLDMGGDEKFFCTNLPEDSEDYPGPESVNLSIRSFPVALEFHNETTGMFYVRPMLLTAVTWR